MQRQDAKPQPLAVTEDLVRILQRLVSQKFRDLAGHTVHKEVFPALAEVDALRRSEMLAVTADKLQGNILTIDAALVSNDEGEFILKTTKTTSSTREIWVPDYVADLIRKNGVAFDGFAGNVLRYLHRAQDALGLPRCRLHDLRHYYVSMSHSLGIPDAYIQQAVGHSSIQTTRNVYLHAQTEKIEDMERRAADFLIK